LAIVRSWFETCLIDDPPWWHHVWLKSDRTGGTVQKWAGHPRKGCGGPSGGLCIKREDAHLFLKYLALGHNLCPPPTLGIFPGDPQKAGCWEGVIADFGKWHQPESWGGGLCGNLAYRYPDIQPDSRPDSRSSTACGGGGYGWRHCGHACLCAAGHIRVFGNQRF